MVLVLYGDITSCQVHSAGATQLTVSDIVNMATFGDGAGAAVIVGSRVARSLAEEGLQLYRVQAISSFSKPLNHLELSYTLNKVPPPFASFSSPQQHPT